MTHPIEHYSTNESSCSRDTRDSPEPRTSEPSRGFMAGNENGCSRGFEESPGVNSQGNDSEFPPSSGGSEP